MASSVSRRGWKFYFTYSLFLLLLLLFAVEGSLRLLGHQPWQKADTGFQVEPGGTLFSPDSILGFKGKPGKFRCNIGGKRPFNVTHNADGFRPTTGDELIDSLPKPEIWIFGCSFTHGYGVDDSASWPWLVQKALPQFKIRNFAMTAYSTYQSRLLMESLIARPHGFVHTAVLAYGGFHNQRNTASRFWKKAIDGQGAANGITYPYLLPDENEGIKPYREQLHYEPWPGQTISAFIHFLENRSNHREYERLRSDEITVLEIRAMHELSKLLGAQFLIATVQRDETGLRTLDFLNEMRTIDISADLEDPTLRILPEDGHPNAAGHQKMAESFLRQFNQR